MTGRDTTSGPREEISVAAKRPSESVKRTYRDIIVRAIELLERPYGWTKGQMVGQRPESYGGGQNYCAVGAIYQAKKELGMSSASAETAIRRVAAAISTSRTENTVIGFNDAPGRTKQEVVALLRRVVTTSSSAAPQKDVKS